MDVRLKIQQWLVKATGSWGCPSLLAPGCSGGKCWQGWNLQYTNCTPCASQAGLWISISEFNHPKLTPQTRRLLSIARCEPVLLFLVVVFQACGRG